VTQSCLIYSREALFRFDYCVPLYSWIAIAVFLQLFSVIKTQGRPPFKTARCQPFLFVVGWAPTLGSTSYFLCPPHAASGFLSGPLDTRLLNCFDVRGTDSMTCFLIGFLIQCWFSWFPRPHKDNFHGAFLRLSTRFVPGGFPNYPVISFFTGLGQSSDAVFHKVLQLPNHTMVTP